MYTSIRVIRRVTGALLGAASLSCAAQSINGSNAYVSSVALGPNSTIFIGGEFTAVGGAPRAGLARLHTDGRLDGSFVPALNPASRVDSMAVQADGKVVIGGYFPQSASPAYSLLRLNSDGSADTLAAQPNASPAVLYVQVDGKILVGGTGVAEVANLPRAHIARLNADLTLDTVFQPSVPPDSDITSFAEQSDGSIIIAGRFKSLADPVTQILAYSVGRVDSNGNVDSAFTFPVRAPGNSPYYIYQARLRPSGKIVVGGLYLQPGGATTTVSQHNSDASIDTADFTPNTLGGPNVLTLQADGKVLLGGVFSQIGNATAMLAHNNIGRLNADGSPDAAFMTQTDSGPSGQVIAIVQQPDAKILIGGTFSTVDNQPRSYLTRVQANGAIDVTFNVNDVIFAGHFDP